MKRKTKNIIMIPILIILIGCLTFTILYINKNSKNDVNVEFNQSMQNNMFQKSEGNSTNNTLNNNENVTNMENSEDFKEKPDGDGSNVEKEDGSTPQDKPDGDTSTPPEKPDGDMNNGETNNADNNSSSDSTEENTDNNLDMSKEIMSMPNMNVNNEINLSTLNLIILIVECTLITILVLYLIMSKLNKYSLKETFKNKDKVIIFILSSVIMTYVLFIGSKLLINNISFENNSISNDNSSVTYSGALEITEDKTINEGEYADSTVDSNVLLINGDIDVTLKNLKINKTGDSDSGDNTSFYGINSAILAKSGASVKISNLTINTDATGANGVFSYGGSATTNNTSSDGTKIEIENSTITTSKDSSGGIMVSGGGVLSATDVTVETSGTSSAAIRSDRGGGDINVSGGTFTTNGKGSPSIYSTASITVKDAKLVSNASEGIIIEGNNSVSIDDVELTSNNTELNGNSTTYKNIFLYQSMSGDASEGESSFSAVDSTIITNNGDSFYVTNTTSTITLQNNKITNNDSNGYFLRIQKDSWGEEGKNGGNVTLTLKDQDILGNIYVDSISTLNMTLTDKSYFEGSINSDNLSSSVTLKLDKNSKIKLTSDTYIKSLDNADSSNSNIDLNGYKLYVDGKEIK